jgi:hypothetical protein
MDGMKLSPMGQFTWLVSFFLVVFFFSPISNPQLNFYFFGGTNFIPIFFGPPLNQSFFLGSSYLHPTYLPPFFLPTHLLPSCCQTLPTLPFALISNARQCSSHHCHRHHKRGLGGRQDELRSKVR